VFFSCEFPEQSRGAGQIPAQFASFREARRGNRRDVVCVRGVDQSHVDARDLLRRRRHRKEAHVSVLVARAQLGEASALACGTKDAAHEVRWRPGAGATPPIYKSTLNSARAFDIEQARLKPLMDSLHLLAITHARDKIKTRRKLDADARSGAQPPPGSTTRRGEG
jgi:hypothetical protein